MTKPHQEDQIEPFFITEDVAAELTAAGYEFEPPGHARTASIRELFGWQPGETLSEAVSRHLEKAGTGGGRDPITVSGLQNAFRRLWARYAVHCEGKAITFPRCLASRCTICAPRPEAMPATKGCSASKNVSTFRSIYDRKPVRAKPSK